MISTEQLPVVWITAGTSSEEIHIARAVALGCQSYITFTEDVTNFLKFKLTVKDSSDQRMRDKNFLIFAKNLTLLQDNLIMKEAFNCCIDKFSYLHQSNKLFFQFTQIYGS